MNKEEKTFKEYLIRIMGTRWDVQSHEDKYSAGVPDLSYGAEGCNGWIELKHIIKWPFKDGTSIKFSRYTPQQVNWLISRGKKGGHCFLMIKISNTVGSEEYLIFASPLVRAIKHGMNRSELYSNCIANFEGSVDPAALKEILVSNACSTYVP